MDDEMKDLLKGSSAASEVRTLNPHVAAWTPAVEVAKVLGVQDKRVYGWIYRKLIEGCKKEGGKLLVPQAELNRLIGMRDAGTLDDEMTKGQRKGGARNEKKCVGKRHVSAPVEKKPAAKAARQLTSDEQRVKKEEVEVINPPLVKTVTMTPEDLRSLVHRVIELQKVCDPFGLSVYLMDV